MTAAGAVLNARKRLSDYRRLADSWLGYCDSSILNPHAKWCAGFSFAAARAGADPNNKSGR